MDLEIYRDYEEFDREFDRKYQETKEHEIKVAGDFVEIGYLLKRAIDTDVLCGSEYQNIYEYAEKKYNIDKSRVSRFIKINDRFSEGGYSRILKEQYEDFGWSKLTIMLQLPEEINEELTPEFSKADIQSIHEEVKEEQKLTDIEVLLEDKNENIEQEENLFGKAMMQLWHDEPALYLRTSKIWDRCPSNEEVVNSLAPSGASIYTVRIPGTGRIMISIKTSSEEVTLTNIRSGEKKTYSKKDVIPYLPAGENVIELWERKYEEPWPIKEEHKEEVKEEFKKAAESKKESKNKSKVTKAKVAPVQPKTEVVPEVHTETTDMEETTEPEDKKAEIVAVPSYTEEESKHQEEHEEVEVVSGEVEPSDLENIKEENEFKSEPETDYCQPEMPEENGTESEPQSQSVAEKAPALEESKREPVPDSLYLERMTQYREMYDNAVKAAGDRIANKQFTIAMQEIEVARKAIEYMKEWQDKYEEGQDE